MEGPTRVALACSRLVTHQARSEQKGFISPPVIIDIVTFSAASLCEDTRLCRAIVVVQSSMLQFLTDRIVNRYLVNP